MPGWTLTETHPTHGRTFQRPLDGVELVFFWDGVFNGTTDNLHPVELRLLNHSQDAHLFADGNIVKAWLSTKRRYPLAGATLQVMPGTPTTTGYLGMADPKPESSGDDALKAASGPHFVVREHDLAVLHPNEIIFEQVGSAEEVQQRVADILDGPRPLSHELLAQLYVFREADPERVDVLHLMTLAGHCVTDGMANRTFMRSLLDTIARGGDPASEPTQLPLEERLAMVVPPVDLAPMHLRSFGQAKRRWRLAIAGTIHQLRMKRGQVGTYHLSRPHFDSPLGWAHTPMSPDTHDTVHPRAIWLRLYRAHRTTDQFRAYQLSSVWAHVWECLPCARTGSDDPGSLPTVPPWRNLRRRMGV